MRQHPSTLRLSLLLFGLFAVLYLLTASGRIQQRDEETMYRVTRNLLETGDLAIQSEVMTLEPAGLPGFLPTQEITFESTFASPGRDGRSYSKYGIGQSLATVPLYLLGKVLAPLLPSPTFQYGAKLLVSTFNALMTAATCALLFAWARTLGYSHRTGLLLSTVYGLTTMAWVHTKSFFAQPATSFCLLTAAYACSRFRQATGRRWLVLAGASLGGAILFRPTAAIAIPTFILVLPLCWRDAVPDSEVALQKHAGSPPPAPQPLRDLASFLAPLALALALGALYNVVRFGSFLGSGYSEAGWDTPFLYGLYGLLFSPGKGLFLYNPILILALVGLALLGRQHKVEMWLIAFLTLSYLGFYAGYRFWTGGWNWGPRFLLPLIPLLTLAVAPFLEGTPVRGGRTAFGFLAVLGLLIQLPAVLVDHSRHLVALSEAHPDDYYERSIREAAMSPVVNQWPVTLEVAGLWSRASTWQDVRRLLAQEQVHLASQDTTLNEASNALLRQAEFLRLNAPDFWWLHLYLLGSPLAAALAIPLLLAVGALSLGLAMGRVVIRSNRGGNGP